MGLGDLFTKHADFNCQIQLHELTQVPLLSGKFKAKWTFSHATTASADTDTDSDHAGLQHAGNRRALLHPLSALAAAQRPRSTTPPGGLAVTSRDSEDQSSASSRPSEEHPRALSPPMSPRSPPPGSPDPRTPNPNKTPTAGHSATFSFTSPFGAPGEVLPTPNRSRDQGGPASPGSYSLNNSTNDSPHQLNRSGGRSRTTSTQLMIPAAPPRPEPKGSTAYLTLRAHTVTINRTVHCPVAIPVKSQGPSTLPKLQPCPLKLSIRQELPPGPSNTSSKGYTKTGEVVLDLAQFVGRQKGKQAEEGVTRRYLLKNCKTNATFRITVKMEWIDGEEIYEAPPLKTGQFIKAASSSSIFSSSSANKSTSSVNSKKVPANNASAPIRRESSSSSLSASTPSLPSSISDSQRNRGWHPPTSPFAMTAAASNGVTLGAQESDKTAAEVIEMIFNPVAPSTQYRGGGSTFRKGPLYSSGGSTHHGMMEHEEALHGGDQNNPYSQFVHAFQAPLHHLHLPSHQHSSKSSHRSGGGGITKQRSNNELRTTIHAGDNSKREAAGALPLSGRSSTTPSSAASSVLSVDSSAKSRRSIRFDDSATPPLSRETSSASAPSATKEKPPPLPRLNTDGLGEPLELRTGKKSSMSSGEPTGAAKAAGVQWQKTWG